jgi:hypothetical protein
MKKLISLITVLSCFSMMKAQIHQHDGFYLSMGLGLIFGNITDKSSSYDYTYSGTGSEFDFKIGGAIKENLILHATLDSKAIAGPSVSGSNVSGSESGIASNMLLGEGFYGGGATYYFMPTNFFISGSLGYGYFTLKDSKDNINISTEKGLSFQIKIGEEWWVSDNWGLGIGVTYGKTNLTNKFQGDSEDMDSNRFGIMFNTTFN